MNKPKKWILLAVIASSIFALDQWSKYMAVSHLTNLFQVMQPASEGERVKLWFTEKDLLERGLATAPVRVNDSVWQWRYTQNRGAAWGFLAGSNEKFRVPFFYLVTIAAMVFIFSYLRKLREDQRYIQVALSLLLGGAIGNGVDRVIRGYVIDFIDWHWFDPNWMNPAHHWPTFNIADCGVSVGLVMLLLEMVFVKHPKDGAAEPKPEPKKA